MDSGETGALHNLKHLKASNARIIYIVMGALVLLVAYFVVHGYLQNLKRSKEAVLKRLHSIAFTTSFMIDGDLHQGIVDQYSTKDAIESNEQDSAYNLLHGTLAHVQAVNSLETPIYTFVLFPADSTVRFVISSAPVPYYLHQYKKFPKEIINHYATGFDLDVYEDENGSWLSSFAPIKNHEGNIVALIQADQNFDSYLAQARTELIGNTLLSIGILIPFGILLMVYVTQLLRKQIENQELLHEQNEEIKTQSEIIEKNNQELESKVIQRTSELAQRNEEITTFLYHSSHDVQAPIATLKGLFLIAKNDLKEATAHAYIQRMETTTAALERITQTIKLVHEIKNSSLKPALLPLAKCIERVVYQLNVPEDELKIILDIPESFRIYGDAKLMHTTFSELLKNAHQYRCKNNGEPSQVILSVGSLSVDETHLLMEDNGEGIDPEVEDDIFSMFSRGNVKSNGVGLGLFIAKSCMDRMDGSVEYRTKDTPGSCFMLCFKNQLHT